MKISTLSSMFVIAAGAGLALAPLHAEEKNKKLEKAKNTVDAIRQADPPQASTDTAKPSAQEIARRENAKEQQRQKEESRKHSPDHIVVPPPASSSDTAKGKSTPPPSSSSDTAKGKGTPK